MCLTGNQSPMLPFLSNRHPNTGQGFDSFSCSIPRLEKSETVPMGGGGGGCLGEPGGVVTERGAHTPSFTYTHTHNFVTHTHHLSLSHTIFHIQLCHTQLFIYTLFYFSILHHLLCLSFLPRPRYNICCSLLEEVAH